MSPFRLMTENTRKPKQMIARREAIRLLTSGSACACFAARTGITLSIKSEVSAPRLAPGTPLSPERMALIETFKTSDGLEKV
jgi:hypothetical protein